VTLLRLTLQKDALIEEALHFRAFLSSHPEFVIPGEEDPSPEEMERVNAAFELYLDGVLT
jgi:hypothetical protein